MANENPLILEPPKMNSINITEKVMNEVTIVLPNVLFMAALITSVFDELKYKRVFVRIKNIYASTAPVLSAQGSQYSS